MQYSSFEILETFLLPQTEQEHFSKGYRTETKTKYCQTKEL